MTTDDITPAMRAIGPAGAWEGFIDRVDAIAEECKIDVDDDGVNVTVVDPAKVAMTDTNLHPPAFDASGLVVGLDIGRFEDALGLADDGDVVEVAFGEETRQFHVRGPDFDFTVSGIDPDTVRQRPDIPELDLPIDVTVAGDRLQRAVEGADMVSDHLIIGWDAADEALFVAAEGDIDDVRFDWTEDDLESVDAVPVEDTSSMYSVDYLSDLVAALDDGPVRLTIGDEFPMKLRQPFADGDADCLYMIAPRITSE